MNAHDVDQDDELGKLPFKNSGRWIALDVDIFTHPIVGPPKDQPWQNMIVWQWMIAEANHRPYHYDVNGRIIKLSRGQLVISERHIARKANWTRKKATSFLAKLERLGMIETLTTRPEGQLILDFVGPKRGPIKGPTLTIVTICNYNKYQFSAHVEGANKGATREPPRRHYPTRETDKIGLHQSLPLGVKGEEDAREDVNEDKTDGGWGERLPFTGDVLRALVAMDVDLDALIERYRKRTKGKRIDDPSAYLLGMGRDDAAKRLGVSKEALKRLTSKNKAERAIAMGAAVGAFSKPSDAAIGKARRWRDPNVDTALQRLAGKTFASQDAADRAFRGELTILRFSGRAA